MIYLLPLFIVLLLLCASVQPVVAGRFPHYAQRTYFGAQALIFGFALVLFIACAQQQFLIFHSAPLFGASFSVDYISIFFVLVTLLIIIAGGLLNDAKCPLFVQAALLITYISSDIIHMLLWSTLALWAWYITLRTECTNKDDAKALRFLPLCLMLVGTAAIFVIVVIVGHSNIANIALFLTTAGAPDKTLVLLLVGALYMGVLAFLILYSTSHSAQQAHIYLWALWCMWLYLFIRFFITMLALNLVFVQQLFAIIGTFLLFILCMMRTAIQRPARICTLHVLLAITTVMLFTPAAFITSLTYITQVGFCMLLILIVTCGTQLKPWVRTASILTISALPPFALFWSLLDIITLATQHNILFLIAVSILLLILFYHGIGWLRTHSRTPHTPSPTTASLLTMSPAKASGIALLLIVVIFMVPLALKPTAAALSKAALDKQAYINALHQKEQ